MIPTCYLGFITADLDAHTTNSSSQEPRLPAHLRKSPQYQLIFARAHTTNSSSQEPTLPTHLCKRCVTVYQAALLQSIVLCWGEFLIAHFTRRERLTSTFHQVNLPRGRPGPINAGDRHHPQGCTAQCQLPWFLVVVFFFTLLLVLLISVSSPLFFCLRLSVCLSVCLSVSFSLSLPLLPLPLSLLHSLSLPSLSLPPRPSLSPSPPPPPPPPSLSLSLSANKCTSVCWGLVGRIGEELGRLALVPVCIPLFKMLLFHCETKIALLCLLLKWYKCPRDTMLFHLTLGLHCICLLTEKGNWFVDMRVAYTDDSTACSSSSSLLIGLTRSVIILCLV